METSSDVPDESVDAHSGAESSDRLLEKLERDAPKAAEVLTEGASATGENPQEIVSILRQEISSFSGPIPPPDVLGAYSPEQAERIISMAEREQEARLERGRQEDQRMNTQLDHQGKMIATVQTSTFHGQCASVLIAIAGITGMVFLLKYAPNAAGGWAAAALATAAFGPMAFQLINGKGSSAPPNETPQAVPDAVTKIEDNEPV